MFFETDTLPQNITECETPLLAEAAKQLNRYLAGELKKFTLPLRPSGTPFMQRVWALFCEIPYGRIVTYKEIAAKIGNQKASRVIGMVSSRNPLPIFIPCHRIIGANGKLTGYRGGLAVKEVLLNMEGRAAKALL